MIYDGKSCLSSDLIAASLNGTLDSAEEAAVTTHRANCVSCDLDYLAMVESDQELVAEAETQAHR